MLHIENLSGAAFGPVSLSVEAGECLGLGGPSGAGKTLLLRAIADLDPNQGTVGLNGDDRDAMPAWRCRRRVVYVASEAGWWAETAKAHFADWRAVTDMAGALGLAPGTEDRAIDLLSTGERQRLALMLALALAPEVLLLDEPTSGLDPASAGAAETLVRERLDAGAAVIWVTHDAGQAGRMAARRATMLAGGRLAGAAAP